MKLPKSNPYLIATIRVLRKAAREHRAAIWDALADELEKPKRFRRAVNLSRINRYVEEGGMAAVPGKVLGSGTLTKRVTVAALAFSAKAKAKIEEAGGRCISLRRLVEENPRGSYVRILG